MNTETGITTTGLVIKSLSGFYTVYTQSGEEVVCHLRGRLKQVWKDVDIVTIGDQVEITQMPDGTGTIESVAERKTALMRRARVTRRRRFAEKGMGHLERDRGVVILANPDQAVFVFACANPEPSLRMLDRFLVVAEANHIPAIICANKFDLVTPEEATEKFDIYRQIGYSVHYTSAAQNIGITDLHAALKGKLSVLAGPSGVGKSSLMNVIDPHLGQLVGQISHSTGKGRHTTVHPELFALPGGGWLADTPGIRSLSLFDLTPEEIDGYFVEIAPLVQHCAFRDCSHEHEEDCAVRAALTTGQLSHSRYESYLRLRAGLHD